MPTLHSRRSTPRACWRARRYSEQSPKNEDLIVHVAIGLKARTGRAALVALAGDLQQPHFIERSQLQLLPDGAWAPYHAAAELNNQARARESVRRSIAAAQRLATSGIRT